MATWLISVIDQFKAGNGSSEDNQKERTAKEKFGAKLVDWHRASDNIKDDHLNTAWQSNYQGLNTCLSGTSRGHYLFKVYQSTTDVAYLMGELSIGKWGLNINEVISNPAAEADLAKFIAEVDQEEQQNPNQTRESIGAMRSRIDSTRADLKTSKPLSCLFAWAATNAAKVKLIANTYGLVVLYGKFGFELDGPCPPYQTAVQNVAKATAALEKEPTNTKLQKQSKDAKFAQVNAAMLLSQAGRLKLSESNRPLVDYYGPAIP